MFGVGKAQNKVKPNSTVFGVKPLRSKAINVII